MTDRDVIKGYFFNVGMHGFNGVSERMDKQKQRALKGLFRNMRNPRTDAHRQNQRFLDALQIKFPADVVFYLDTTEERHRVENAEEFQDALRTGPSDVLRNNGFMIDIDEQVESLDKET